MSKKIYVIDASKLDERISFLKRLSISESGDEVYFRNQTEIKTLHSLQQSAKAIIIPTDEEVEKMAEEEARLNFGQHGGYCWIREKGFTAGAKSIIKQ